MTAELPTTFKDFPIVNVPLTPAVTLFHEIIPSAIIIIIIIIAIEHEKSFEKYINILAINSLQRSIASNSQLPKYTYRERNLKRRRKRNQTLLSIGHTFLIVFGVVKINEVRT